MTYMEQMVQDIKQYIYDEVSLKNYNGRDQLSDKLYDMLWAEDSVTGNGSGSYTFSSLKAKENVLADGIEYYKEACVEFCIDAARVAECFLNEQWEDIDVTIRCYLLGQAIENALDEMEEDGELNFGEE